MTTFANFSDTLPDPAHKIGYAGQADVNGMAGPGFASETVGSIEPIMNMAVTSGRLEPASGYHHKWEVTINYNPLTCMEFHPVYAFLLYRKHTLKPFYVSLPQYASQTTTNKQIDQTAVRGAETILVHDLGGPAVAAQPGQIFKFSNHEKIYMVTRVETNTQYLTDGGQPSAGQTRLHITPRLQREVPYLQTLSFTDPKIQVIQVEDVVEYSVGDSNLFQFQVKLEEVLYA